MLARALAPGLALLTLVGCVKGVDSPNTIVVYDEPGPAYYVHEIRLKDGTRCVVSTSALSDGGTGIACDWNSQESPER